MNVKALTVLCAVVVILPLSARSQTPVSPIDNPTIVVHGEKSDTPRRWFKTENAHFIVYSDARHGDAAELIENLERFTYVLRSFSQMEDLPAEGVPKFTIYYLTDRRDLKIIEPGGPDSGVGLYRNCEDSVAGFAMYEDYKARPDLAVGVQPENRGLVQVFQAYARHFFYHSFPQRRPLWYIEGYAQYFSTMRFEADQAIVGLPPQNSGALLMLLDRNRLKPSLDHKDLLIGDDRYHTDFSADTYARSRPAGMLDKDNSVRSDDRYGGDPKQAAERSEAEFGARAWILTHWVLSKPSNLEKLQTYIAAIESGDSDTTAFRRAFGLNPGQVESEMRRYLQGNLQSGSWTLNFPGSPIVQEDLAETGDLLLRRAALMTCPTEAYGRSLLGDFRSAAARAPDSVLTQKALARAEIGFGDPNRALTWLAPEVSAHPDDFEAQYLLGRSELAIAAMAKGDAQADAYDAALQAFTVASKLDPGSATNAFWYYRAQVLATGRLEDDAAGAAILAWRLAPEVDAYAFNAALVYAHAGKRDQARDMLKTIANNPRPSEWVGLARIWIIRLNGIAPRPDIIRGIQAAVSPQPGQSEWTLAIGEVLGNNELDAGWNDFLSMKKQSPKLVPGRYNSAPRNGETRPAEEQ